MSTWGDVNRVSIDREDPVVEEPAEETPEEEPESNPGQAVGVSEGMEIFLLVGSDSRDELEDATGFGDFAGPASRRRHGVHSAGGWVEGGIALTST